MKKRERLVTVTVEVEYEGVTFTRKIRAKNVSILAYMMRDIAIAGAEIRQDILAHGVAQRKRNNG